MVEILLRHSGPILSAVGEDKRDNGFNKYIQFG